MNRYYFWKAAKIACQAVIQFAARYSKKTEELAKCEKDKLRKKNYWPLVKYVRENKEQDIKFIL